MAQQAMNYVTVTHGSRGYFAVLVSPDGEPIETGPGRYDTFEQALVEADDWAKSEHVGLKVKPRRLNKRGDCDDLED